MTDLRVTKNIKKIKFEGLWGKRVSNILAKAIPHKAFDTNSSFHEVVLLILARG